MEWYELALVFGEWLLDRAPHAIVGVSGMAQACPVANFLRDWNKQLGVDITVEVGSANIGITDQSTGYTVWKHVPAWVALFTDAIDAGHRRQVEPVTAGEAVIALKDVLSLFDQAGPLPRMGAFAAWAPCVGVC